MKKIITVFIFLFVSNINVNPSIAESTLRDFPKKKISHTGKKKLKIPSQLLAVKLQKRDPSLIISIESVLQKLKNKQKLFLIDVRNKEEFKKFRIPGSINIPLFAIKTKVFLKSKPLVLMNEGYKYSELEPVCKDLKNFGFDSVSILNGGLSHWIERNGALEGDLFAQKDINKIPPRVLFTEKNYENWIMIDVSKSSNTEANHLIPPAVHLPYRQNDPEDFVAKFKATISKYKKPFLFILIFDETGKSYENIEIFIRETGTNFVFYLKGGLDGYKTFLQQQVRIWQSKDKSKKKKCRSCS